MTSKIKSFFDKNGYYLAKKVFNESEVIELEQSFDKIIAQLTQSNEEIDATWSGEQIQQIKSSDDCIIHTHNVHRYSNVWLRAMLHPNFIHYATQILGKDIVLHHNKLFQKPAENGAPFPMHQDWSYFPTLHDTMIAGIIHVSNATDEMGCLRIYEGTHKLGRQAQTDGQSSNEALAKEYPIENATIIEAEPGDVLFFHYFTLHGSMPNRSSKIRKTVLVQMHSGKDKMEPEIDHPNEAIVLNGWNYHSTRKNAGALKI